MKMAGVRQFRSQLTDYVSGEEPVLLTRHGRVSGVFLPLEDPGRVPEDLRRELAAVLGAHLSAQLEVRGVTEEMIQDDFRAYRRGRR